MRGSSSSSLARFSGIPVIFLALIGPYAAFTGVPRPEARNMRRERGGQGSMGGVKRTVFCSSVLVGELDERNYC